MYNKTYNKMVTAIERIIYPSTCSFMNDTEEKPSSNDRFKYLQLQPVLDSVVIDGIVDKLF